MRNSIGQAKTGFVLSESAPDLVDWGHTGYITVDTQEPLVLDDKTELILFFTPRRSTTFEEVEQLALQMDKILEKVHFNLSGLPR
jgi:hypothetical protein